MHYLTELKNIFRTYNEETAIKRLETLLEKFDDFHKVFNEISLKRYFQTLTAHTLYEKPIYRTNIQ